MKACEFKSSCPDFVVRLIPKRNLRYLSTLDNAPISRARSVYLTRVAFFSLEGDVHR